jgi:putative DNA primase/helicase
MSDKFGFHNENSGLWFYPFPTKDKDDKEVEHEPVWLCAPLLVVALAIDENERWGRLLEWVDPDGRIVRWMMPDRMLAEKDKPWVALRDRGLHMTTDAAALGLLRKYINTADTDKRVYVVERLGWFEKDAKLSYLLPDRVIGDVANIYYTGDQLAYTVLGSVEDWQQQIGQYCRGNSRMLFAVSVAFAPPLLYLLGEPSGGYNIWGVSQIGKTATTSAANTVGGWPKRTWRTTDNALEGVAEQRCDGLLYLDEMGEVDPHVAGKIAYMIANGSGKGRATVTGDAKPIKHWRALLLSSGELTLADKMNEAGEKRRGGQETRLCDIPADVGSGMGVFENIHGAPSSREFVKQLETATLNVSGSAFIAYIEKLIDCDRSALSKMLRQQYDGFINDNAPVGSSAQVGSICGRFALVAVAG